MNFFVSILLSLALANASPSGYIIKLKQGASTTKVSSFVQSFNSRRGVDIESVTDGSVKESVKYTYSSEAFKGMAGQFTPEFLEALQREHRRDLEYIVPDGKRHISAVQTKPGSWGLRRISQRILNLKAGYEYPDEAGQGVDVWIIDTGIRANLTQFEGRATFAKSFVQGEENTDLNGHGTHVAGTIGSALYGVAKKAKLFGVKVLNADGEGNDSDVLAGIEHVLKNIRKGKTVVNMSLGGDFSRAINDAVNALVKAGAVMVVAAGNDGVDACDQSPAGASDVLTVGATDNTDTIADFSNTGKCVGVFAPGVDITSTWIGVSKNTISGTSMASPHVAGIAALYMSVKTFQAPKDVYAAIKAYATPKVIKGLGSDSPNLLAFDKLSAPVKK